jgi:hypothetical protein
LLVQGATMPSKEELPPDPGGIGLAQRRRAPSHPVGRRFRGARGNPAEPWQICLAIPNPFAEPALPVAMARSRGVLPSRPCDRGHGGVATRAGSS